MEKINSPKNYFNGENYKFINPDKKLQPFCCPICQGKGKVSGGFYNSVGGYSTSNCAAEQCRSCNGTGIIWG